jgi:hypothetical protein
MVIDPPLILRVYEYESASSILCNLIHWAARGGGRWQEPGGAATEDREAIAAEESVWRWGRSGRGGCVSWKIPREVVSFSFFDRFSYRGR